MICPCPLGPFPIPPFIVPYSQTYFVCSGVQAMRSDTGDVRDLRHGGAKYGSHSSFVGVLPGTLKKSAIKAATLFCADQED
jgi:hypothetical protein